jgi:hypothetical protein
MAYTYKLRRDLSSRWTTVNPVLAQGEPGYEFDTGKLKIGDGVKVWTALPYLVETDGLQAHAVSTENPHAVTKAQVGLVDAANTSDANKPVSIAQQIALDIKADLVNGKVPTSQVPAIATGETVTVANQAVMLSLTAEQVQPGDVAIRSDQDGRRWLLAATNPSVLGSWIALEVPDAVSSVQGQQGAVILGKADVGLGSVDNTADIAKPVSAAQQAALSGAGYRAGWRPGKAVTLHRDFVSLSYNAGVAVSGVLQLVALASPLLAGESYSAISFLSAGNFTTPTRQWFCLVRRSDLTVLGSTVDDTTAAWNSGEKQLALSTPYVPAVTEEAYVGLYVTAAGLPNMYGLNILNTERMLSPAIGGRSSYFADSGPLADGTVVAAPSATGHGQVFRGRVF